MHLFIKKKISQSFWILRCIIGFVYISGAIHILMTVNALHIPELTNTFPKDMHNLGVSPLTYTTIKAYIELFIGILLFTPYVRAAVYTAITWLFIMQFQSTESLAAVLSWFNTSNIKLINEQILVYYNKTIFRILLLAALLALNWITQARERLKD